LSLAGRVPFLGFRTGEADYRTLILQAEVAPKRMQGRLLRQMVGFPYEAGDRVLSASVFSSIKLDSEEGRNTVRAWVDERHPDLLIVDPLSNFHCGNENEARDMLKITSVLDDIRSTGVAVALIHHHGKSSAGKNVGYKARGSSALPGWYDSHLSLEWADFPRTVRLEFELRHDEKPEDIILRLNPDTLLFEVQNDEASQITLVVSVIRDIGQADAVKVASRCGRTRQWASEWLGRAVEEGKLGRTGNHPVLFHLPEAPPPMTTVEIPTQNGGQPIVVSTNTAGGLNVEEPEAVFDAQ
jgi:hypothetical protein